MAQFFAGRTGVDALGRTVTWVALILMFLTTFTHSNTVYLLSMACLAYSIWRMLSKNYQKRYNENQLFLQKTVKIRAFFSKLVPNIKNKVARMKFDANQRKVYAIFKCPSCKQKLRAPRGRGKIEVTCSKCHTVFVKRV
ncbi:MAG: zf-TFIIB domain-containing protein [Pseudobutyrivibrio sp.]|nr:zf-TFIIB domain-containing protein [Pseudobutyrivibrio sp.]